MKFFHVYKDELPIGVAIEDRRGGKVEVLELAPAGKGKLSAYLRSAGEVLKRAVLALLPGK